METGYIVVHAGDQRREVLESRGFGEWRKHVREVFEVDWEREVADNEGCGCGEVTVQGWVWVC